LPQRCLWRRRQRAWRSAFERGLGRRGRPPLFFPGGWSEAGGVFVTGMGVTETGALEVFVTGELDRWIARSTAALISADDNFFLRLANLASCMRRRFLFISQPSLRGGVAAIALLDEAQMRPRALFLARRRCRRCDKTEFPEHFHDFGADHAAYRECRDLPSSHYHRP